MGQHKPPLSPAAAAERGLHAFHGGRFADAIALLAPHAQTHPRIAAALAEVYFRRALARHTPPEQQLSDLQRAADLAPDDAVYQYHLGLAYHRRGDRSTALIAYQMALQANPQQRGLPFAYALALIESDPQADLSALTALPERERALVSALAAFLRGDAHRSLPLAKRDSWFGGLIAKLSGPDPLDTLWRGLVALHAGDDVAARASLSSSASNLPPKADALRHYYLGVIATRQNDLAGAQAEWQQARARGLDTPWLRQNLAVFHLHKAIADVQAERWSEAAPRARGALQADPQNLAAVEVALVALDRLAHEAVGRNDWATASQHWAEAKTIHAQSGSKSPPRLILQNLAIAYEAQEQWEPAGEAWRDLLRSKPRGKKAKSEYTEAQWEWIRKRATEVFKQAARPDATIDFLKKAVKSDPNNVAKRLELADALLANDQQIAARNQLQSAREIDPKHVPTMLKMAELHVRRGEWYAAEQQVQQALEQEPQNEDLRQRLVQLMLQRGAHFHQGGMHDAARKVYEEALTHAPNNPDIHIAIARVDLDGRRIKAARERLEQAIALNPRRVETYVQVVNCWAIERNIKEVRKTIAQAEANAQPDARFYLISGLACLKAIPPLQPARFGLFGPARAPTKKQGPGEWEVLTDELFGRALALRPDDLEALHGIVAESVSVSQPRLGLRYAERLRQLAPDDPAVLISLGLLQGLNEQTDEAKRTLQQAARLARQRGDHELERTANEMRREVSNPMFAMMINMASLLGPPPEEFYDEMDDEEFLDEILRVPQRRRRRRR